MDHEMEVEVFRAGGYGPRGDYSEGDLDRIAEDYSKSVHEAPVTLDHRQDGPALGWVRGLRRAGQVLLARLGGLDEALVEKIKSGAFKKRSVEFYRSMEATGRPYLRAVTFLGAGAPVVKGLSDPLFAESEGCARIEFTEGETSSESSESSRSELLEGLNDSGEALESDGAEDSAKDFNEEKERVEIDESTRAFFEEICEQGRFLPAWEEKGIALFMAGLDDVDLRCFQEDRADETSGMTQRSWFREFLEDLAPMVPLGEATPAPRKVSSIFGEDAGEPSNLRGARIDEESLSLHKRTCRFLDSHPDACYAEALRYVSLAN